MTEKTVNYTPEMEARMAEVYVPSAEQAERETQVKELANEFNKSTRSVVAKLTTLGLYVPKVYVTKKNEKPVSKAELVAKLESFVGASLESFEKATKKDLETVLTAFNK